MLRLPRVKGVGNRSPRLPKVLLRPQGAGGAGRFSASAFVRAMPRCRLASFTRASGACRQIPAGPSHPNQSRHRRAHELYEHT